MALLPESLLLKLDQWAKDATDVPGPMRTAIRGVVAEHGRMRDVVLMAYYSGSYEGDMLGLMGRKAAELVDDHPDNFGHGGDDADR